jgi:hypothetical protein
MLHNPNILDVFNMNNYFVKTNIMSISNIQDDSKLFLGFPFIGHGNTDKN